MDQPKAWGKHLHGQCIKGCYSDVLVHLVNADGEERTPSIRSNGVTVDSPVIMLHRLRGVVCGNVTDDCLMHDLGYFWCIALGQQCVLTRAWRMAV